MPVWKRKVCDHNHATTELDFIGRAYIQVINGKHKAAVHKYTTVKISCEKCGCCWVVSRARCPAWVKEIFEQLNGV